MHYTTETKNSNEKSSDNVDNVSEENLPDDIGQRLCHRHRRQVIL